jgi:hypothetical protein
MAARVAALDTIEPYAFAIHQQLAFNFAETGEFFQTIHKGYGDEWAWSGHRAATLPINAWLYSFAPSPTALSTLLITWLLLGALPAAGLGYIAAKHPLGAILGAGLYLTTPTVWALALQDYQDLVLALPALLFTLWAMHARNVSWVMAGALLGCTPREECLALVIACAIVMIPIRESVSGWRRFDARRWARNVGVSLAVVLLYAGFLSFHHGQTPAQHDMPLVGAVQELFAGELPGLPFWDSFYVLLFAPLGALFMILAPEVAIVGVLLTAFHLTVSRHHGVDRSWTGHVHHMAPAVAFLTAATIIGAGRVLRVLSANTPSVRSARGAATALLTLLLVVYSTYYTTEWGQSTNLRVTMKPLEPVWESPAWALVRQLPADAIPIVPNEVSIAVANRPAVYTYRESLLDKAPDQGMGAGTHLILNNAHKTVRDWALQMAGAEVVDTAGMYTLIRWDAGAKDLSLPRDPNLGLPRPGDTAAGRQSVYPGLINQKNTPDR